MKNRVSENSKSIECNLNGTLGDRKKLVNLKID